MVINNISKKNIPNSNNFFYKLARIESSCILWVETRIHGTWLSAELYLLFFPAISCKILFIWVNQFRNQPTSQTTSKLKKTVQKPYLSSKRWSESGIYTSKLLFLYDNLLFYQS